MPLCASAQIKAESQLPTCPGSPVHNNLLIALKWKNCIGTYTDNYGNQYVGNWNRGKRNGHGTSTSKNGEKYIGDWEDGIRSGNGTLIDANGDKYVGAFKDGRQEGYGVEYAPNGTVISQGIWRNGKLVEHKPLQQPAEPNADVARLRSEIEQAKRKQSEAEIQQRLQAQLATQRQRELEAQMVTVKSKDPPASDRPVAIQAISNRRALVIGNDLYGSIAKLENAREDARTIAANLTALGYQVTLKLDLNEKEMKSAIRTFAAQVQGGDEVLFFFAGHGVQLGAANYLLPTDIAGEDEAQVKDEAIQLQRILDDMAERKAKFTLAMIDACRDNPFKASGRAIGGRGLAPTTAATGQMVIFSAGIGQQALDKLGPTDKNKNGVFTRVFAQEMQKPGLSIDLIVKNVRNQVAELAKSVGREQVPAIYDQVLGDFYFAK